MARIIHPDKRGGPAGGCGCRRWRVAGVRYDNAAVKFWSALLDEVRADYPPETAIAVSAATDGLLLPDALDPGRELQRELTRLGTGDIRRAMRETLAVLAITGPPPPVTVRLLQPGRRRPLLQRRLDVVDADILPFLLAWLLRWAGVPPEQWNEGRVAGAFVAEDSARHVRYELRAQFAARHMREGLFQREVILGRGGDQPAAEGGTA